MSADIVVVGSLNLDLVVEVERVPRAGETVLGGDLVRHPGGKGANQAVAAGRLGGDVAMCGRVGDDEAGELLRRSLHEAGVDDGAVLATEAVPTGTALIAVESSGDNAIVVSPGANARLSAADVAAAPAVSTADVVLVQLEVPIDTVAAAVDLAAGRVVLNPAPAAELPGAVLAGIDVLVPNEHELGLLAGRVVDVSDLAAVAEAARSLAVATVVVTLGARGALLVDGASATHVAAPIVQPVDTTAAGDSFCAALAVGFAGGHDAESAVEQAVRVGAATTLRAGAQPSLPTPEDVDALLR